MRRKGFHQNDVKLPHKKAKDHQSPLYRAVKFENTNWYKHSHFIALNNGK